jgi:tRNA (cmo5U34)-methyltransferase
MPAESDLVPGQRWTFDEGVTAVFDDMLARSIPQYDVMRETVTALADQYATDGSWIVDLGCSSGGSLERIIKRRGARNRYLGCEVSEPMIAAARERFSGWEGRVEIRDLDLRTDYPRVPASVTLSVLTLMFVPIEYRQQVVAAAYDHLADGGAMIVVEKVLGDSARLDRTLVDLYYGMKASNGYSPDEIERKRLALEGVLVPVTATWNVEMLRRAGFRDVDCFWRWANFAGWVAVK